MTQANEEEGVGQSLAPVPSNKVAMGGDLQADVAVSQLMAKALVALPKHFHNAPGECLAIVMQARDWGMNPYAVAQKTSVINNRLMYEGQLVQAAINKSGILAERFSFTFEGKGEDLICTASALIKGDKERKSVTVNMPKPGEARNSPLWKTDPEQQLTYKACRIFCRRYCPEIMMGVYTPEDDWRESMELPEVQSNAITQRVAALESTPGITIDNQADPFAEGAISTAASPVQSKGNSFVIEPGATNLIDRETGEILQAKCGECLDRGIDGGCPSCGREK